jgi:hypothetical protein
MFGGIQRGNAVGRNKAGVARRVGVIALPTAFVVASIIVLVSSAAPLRAEGAGISAHTRGFEEVDLEAAEAWDGYRIYYVGDSYQGVPLTEILKYKRYGRTQWAFVYGTCEPAGDASICFPPLQVINSSICNDFPARYYVIPRTFPFRGARAARNYVGGTFDVYTGRTSATTVTADGRNQGIAATELRPVGATAPSRLRPLAKGSMRGKLRCQRRWRADVKGPHGETLRADT